MSTNFLVKNGKQIGHDKPPPPTRIRAMPESNHSFYIDVFPYYFCIFMFKCLFEISFLKADSYLYQYRNI